MGTTDVFVCGVGVGAGELLGLAVVGEHGAEDEGGFGEVDVVAFELFEHVSERVQGIFVVLQIFADLVGRGLLADAPRYIGLVADGGALVAARDFGGEIFAFAASECGDEVAGVGAAAVAFVLVNAFAVVVVGAAAGAGEADGGVLALDVVAVAPAEVDGAFFAAASGGVGEVADVDDDGQFVIVHQGQVHVGRLAVVLPGEAIAGGDDLVGDIFPAEEVVEIVEVVDAPVGHLAVAPIPLPMPVVVEALAHHGGHGGGAGPQIVVDTGGNGLGFGDLADGGTGVESGTVDPEDSAVLAGLEVAGGFFDRGAGALLRAGLDDAVIFAGGGDHLAAFPNAVAYGLFDIDMLAGLTGPDGHEGVPVVWGGDDKGVDVFAVEDFANVGIALDVGVGGTILLLELGKAVSQDLAVRVAEGDDLDALQAMETAYVAPALAAYAGNGEADLFVGASGTAAERGDRKI